MSALESATEHQPRARMILAAALRAGPSHAYLFRGPRGSGKRAAARAFAAEILAAAAPGPDDTRRRALLDPSPHPDLVWLAPSGSQHRVEEVRERVIRAAAYRPFEGGRCVFVIEAAEAMRDESQNALLKTLEEPPGFAHLILLCAEPAGLLETIASRCQAVEFAPLSAEAIAASLAGDADEVAAAARLAAGDPELARYLLDPDGRRLREAAEHGDWSQLLKIAEAAGEEAEAGAREALEEERRAGAGRSAREAADEAKRVGRRRRTEVLDLGLSLAAAWYRDLAAAAAGAEEAMLNRDRLEQLRAGAQGLDPAAPRRAVELVQDTRRRLDLNVSEELALEALFYRLPVLAA
jgi:DNA polymerase-3 subunit delta'